METGLEQAISAPWRCPEDGALLRACERALDCTRCGRSYQVRDAIPCFTDDARLDAHQIFERDRRDRQLDYEGDPRVRYERRVELEAVIARLPIGPNQRVLDAGCGAGRITLPLARSGAAVTGVDFSWARLQFLRSRSTPAMRLELAAADLNRLPLPPEQFDVVVSTQVLEHVTTEDARCALLHSMWRLLKPGGTLLLTVYNYSEPWQRRGAAKEGLHNTGIFYHCYTAAELQQQLRAFELLELCGIINLLPHTYRAFAHLGAPARWLDHSVERRLPLSRKWGHLLLARARKRGRE